MKACCFPFCRGFSLIEMIIAISVLGILTASTAVFLRGPIASYFDTERRVDIANAGELAMAKMAYEISRAVPNSVRVTIVGSGFYLEFLPVVSEGIYESSQPSFAGEGDVPNTGFDALCTPLPAPEVPCPTGMLGDWVVINNHVASADVWGGNSRASLTSIVNIAGGVRINHASMAFVGSEAPDHHFQIASATPVTYFCDPTAGVGTLRRFSGYIIQAAQPVIATAAPLAGAQNDLLAAQITACNARVVPGNLRRAQVVALTLTLAAGNPPDSLSLYQAIRVESLP